MNVQSCFTRRHIALALSVLLFVGCRTAQVTQERNIQDEIRAALNQQVDEWNKGDLRGFMEVYWRSDQTRFASGGEISLGWQTVFDRYRKKYGTGKGMGTLRFSNIDVTPLGSDAAMAFGGWHLNRDGTEASGLFTLLFRKTKDGWRVVHDHTSSAAKQ